MGRTRTTIEPVQVDSIPAATLEMREQQLVARAMDLAEQRMKNGTASSQEICHFLKLGSVRSQLENDKLKVEMELAQAKAEAIKAQQRTDELFAEAIKAFGHYHGDTLKDDDETEDEPW